MMGALQMHRSLLYVAAFSGLAAFAGGCDDPAGDYCDVHCRCVNCADNDRDACLVANEAELERADLYDCTDEAETLYDCWVRLNVCTEANQFQVTGGCQSEYDDYLSCIAATSSLR